MPIEVRNVDHSYSKGTPFEHQALKDVSLDFEDGKITAIIGQTGSGKSTLMQHLNALLLPDRGSIDIAGHHIEPNTRPKNVKSLRKDVGLVFQFPEAQLFEETIGKDIAFGPQNFGATEEEALEMARKVLPLVGLDESYMERSPFELSGGQKRRVAIAGILVQDPQVLVLDEPTAGLDPQGAEEILNTFRKLNREQNKTILLVSHDMEQVLHFADNVVVMDQGKPAWKGSVQEFFSRPEMLEDLGIEAPGIVQFRTMLQERGIPVPDTILDEDELVAWIGENL